MNQLQRSSVDFAVLFEAGLDAAVIIDSAQRIHHVNAAFTELFGYSREELLGQNIDDLIVPEELRAETIDVCGRAERGRELSLETVRRRKDGRIVDVWIAATVCETQGGQRFSFVRYRDISERVRAVEELSRRRSEMRMISEHVPVGILRADLNGVALDTNAALDAMLGLPRGSLAGRKMSELLHPDEPAKMRTVREELLRTNATVRLTCRLRRSSESYIRARVTACVIRSTLGEPHHIICLVEDITDAMPAADGNRPDASRRMARGIASDFNNVLTSLHGHALLLLEEADLNEQNRADIQEIIHSTNRAALLSQQLLAHSRQQARRPVIANVNQVLHKMERAIERVTGCGICLEFTFDAAVPCVLADPVQLEQVILKLVASARDAMPNGGDLRITTGCRTITPAMARDFEAAAGDYAEITLRHAGTGTDSDAASRVFDPFFTTRDARRGTGLGLWMAYGIVKQNGGCLKVESEIGGATTFRILLPRDCSHE